MFLLVRVDGVPHDSDPALSSLYRKDGEHRVKGGVEVQVGVDPFASVVKTVPL